MNIDLKKIKAISKELLCFKKIKNKKMIRFTV